MQDHPPNQQNDDPSAQVSLRVVTGNATESKIQLPDFTIVPLNEKSALPSTTTLTTWQAIRKVPRRALLAWGSCICAGILLGYDCFYINGLLGMDQFKLDFGRPSTSVGNVAGFLYSNLDKAIVVSIFALGVSVGAPATGYTADKFGRRAAIFSGSFVHILGIVLQLIAGQPISRIASIALLAIGRLIGGIGLGMLSGGVVLYFNETAPKELRGSLASVYQCGLTGGICISTCIALITKGMTHSGAYRIPIAVQFLWVLLLIVGMFFSPDTPRFWVSKGKHQEAEKALSILVGLPERSPELQANLNELIAANNMEQTNQAGWSACFSGGLKRGSNLRRTILGLGIQLGQQLTGINFMFYYGTSFFFQTNMPKPFLMIIGVTLVNVFGTGFSTWSIESFGRRPLLIWGAAAMAASQFVVALLGTVTDPMKTNYIMYAFICLFCAAYAFTWAPCAWAVTGDIFPASLRSKGIALGTTFNWGSNFIITAVTPYLVDAEYANLKEKVFFIWFALNVLCVICSYFEVYETKGLELEDVDVMVSRDQISPLKSAAWIKTHDVAEANRDDGESAAAVSAPPSTRRSSPASASPCSLRSQRLSGEK